MCFNLWFLCPLFFSGAVLCLTEPLSSIKHHFTQLDHLSSTRTVPDGSIHVHSTPTHLHLGLLCSSRPIVFSPSHRLHGIGTLPKSKMSIYCITLALWNIEWLFLEALVTLCNFLQLNPIDFDLCLDAWHTVNRGANFFEGHASTRVNNRQLQRGETLLEFVRPIELQGLKRHCYDW